MDKLFDANIESIVPFLSPRAFLERFPEDKKREEFVLSSRRQIADILTGKDSRMLAIVGPCSIHDPAAGLEYAERLAGLNRKLNKKLLILMRAYLEKPRTALGWKGFISDPNLDGSLDVMSGLAGARKFLQKLAKIKLPAATEFVDPFVPQYIGDVVSWAAVGARTTESQTHRQMASGLSMPVGFKNNTSGNIQVAVDAIVAAQNPHSFFGIDINGQAAIVTSTGNYYGHLVLRGGENGPNYDSASVAEAIRRLEKSQLPPYLLIDCSHGNSQKDASRQISVCKSILEQRLAGNKNIVGFMLESNLFAGKQKLNGNGLDNLQFGQSITDSCLGWTDTEKLLLEVYESLS